MTRDYIAGLVVSGLLHGGVLFLDHFAPTSPEPVKPDEVFETLVIVPLVPDPPDPIDEPEVTDRMEAPEPMPVPQAPEIISQVRIDDFTQPPQTPGPVVNIDGSVSIIPRLPGARDTLVGKPRSFRIEELDQRPVARFQAKPVYPFELKRQGVEGDVLVGFVVNANGDVVDVQVLRSSHREFEPAALQAVAKWKFRPGRKDARAVRTRMQVPVVFTIDKS